MEKIKDELVFGSGVICSYLLLLFVQPLQLYSLWGSLLILLFVSAYYSFTFFKSKLPYQKLFYYLLTLPIIIGYFALVYKSFGIIDTATNGLVKPDWLNAIYFSVVTWTTLGYGDFKPVEELKPWVIVEAIMGYIYMGLLVGKILFISTQATHKSPNKNFKTDAQKDARPLN